MEDLVWERGGIGADIEENRVFMSVWSDGWYRILDSENGKVLGSQWKQDQQI